MPRMSEREYLLCPRFQGQSCTDMHHFRQYIQLGIIPVAFTLAGFVGLAVTSAGVSLYGEVLWDPLRLIDRWDNRAAAFFASFTFVRSNSTGKGCLWTDNLYADARNARYEYLCQLAQRRKRHGRPHAAVHQHSSRSSALCNYWRLGDVPMGDSLHVRHPAYSNLGVSVADHILKCHRVLVFHEWVHCLPWTLRGYHGHRRALLFPLLP